MADLKAVDLPPGSVIGHDMVVYIKTLNDADLPWQFYGDSMYTNYAGDDEVQEALDEGGKVLRMGR